MNGPPARLHPRPVLRWRALNRTKYRLSWNGDTWTLQATPKAKYPWLLSNTKGVTQEIGAPEIKAAQAMAELWLRLEPLCTAPHEGATSHTSLPATGTDPSAR